MFTQQEMTFLQATEHRLGLAPEQNHRGWWAGRRRARRTAAPAARRRTDTLTECAAS